MSETDDRLLIDRLRHIEKHRWPHGGFTTKELGEIAKALPALIRLGDAALAASSPAPARALLRKIVDATWSHAFEDESVPATKTADKIIDKVLATQDKDAT